MNYNPNEIKKAILEVLDGKKLNKYRLNPWYNGFSGTITRDKNSGQVSITGKLEVKNSTTIHITELPVGFYLDQYKDHLVKLEDEGFIKDFEDRSTEEGFDFLVTCPRTTTALTETRLYEKFKLISRDTENYTLWNEEGSLEKFDSAEDIITRFANWRLGCYETRRQKLISETKEQIDLMNEKLRFILFYLDNTEAFRSKNKKDLIDLLTQSGFESYDKLLQMPIWNLTKEKIAELEESITQKKTYLRSLMVTTAVKMYSTELLEFSY